MKGGIVYGELNNGEFYSIKSDKGVKYSMVHLRRMLESYSNLRDEERLGLVDYTSFKQNLVLPDELL